MNERAPRVADAHECAFRIACDDDCSGCHHYLPLASTDGAEVHNAYFRKARKAMGPVNRWLRKKRDSRNWGERG